MRPKITPRIAVLVGMAALALACNAEVTAGDEDTTTDSQQIAGCSEPDGECAWFESGDNRVDVDASWNCSELPWS